MAARIQPRQHVRHQLVGAGWLFVGVGDAQAAAQVDVMDGNAHRLDRFDQIEHAVQRVEIGALPG